MRDETRDESGDELVLRDGGRIDLVENDFCSLSNALGGMIAQAVKTSRRENRRIDLSFLHEAEHLKRSGGAHDDLIKSRRLHFRGKRRESFDNHLSDRRFIHATQNGEKFALESHGPFPNEQLIKSSEDIGVVFVKENKAPCGSNALLDEVIVASSAERLVQHKTGGAAAARVASNAISAMAMPISA